MMLDEMLGGMSDHLPDVKFLFGQSIHPFDPKSWQMLVRDLFGKEISTFDSEP